MSLFVYGAGCSWWDSIDKVAKLPRPSSVMLTMPHGEMREPSGLPCCPHCKGVLFQIEPKDWWEQVAAYVRKTGDATYPDFVNWLRGRCFHSWAAARNQWEIERAKNAPLL